MRSIGCLVPLAGLLVSLHAPADTIYLKNGVQFDGVATEIPDQEGLYKVTAGKRSLIYRASEIDRVEKNERTGLLDKEALLARWEEKNKQLTEETGLTAEQRRLVRGLMFQLKTENVADRLAIRDKLVSMQAEIDVYGYLLTLYPELSTLLAPNVLEVMFYLDPVRAVDLLKSSAQSTYFGTRATAIDLLGRLHDTGSIPLIARGLADQKQPVQMIAAKVLAELGVKEATPALISLLTDPDQRVANRARDALLALWADQLGDAKPSSVDDWNSFWAGKSTPGTPIQMAKLEPLIAPEDEFSQSIDGNH